MQGQTGDKKMRSKSLNPDEYLKRLHEERAYAINKDIDERQQTCDDFAAYLEQLRRQ